MISAQKARKRSSKMPYNAFLYNQWLTEINEEIKKVIRDSTDRSLKYKLNYFEWHSNGGRGYGFYHEPSPNTILKCLRKMRDLGYTANIQRKQDLSQRAPYNFEYDYMYISW